MCRHADSSEHQNAVKAEPAAKLPNANMVGAMLKMSSQNIADFETFFDTAHAICKQERLLSDYPLELKHLTCISSRKFQVHPNRGEDSCKDFIISTGNDITQEAIADISACVFFLV